MRVDQIVELSKRTIFNFSSGSDGTRPASVATNALSYQNQTNPPVNSEPNVLATIDFTNSPYLSLEALASSDVIIIMVLSKAANIEVRDAIRRTWGFFRSYRNRSIRVKLFFLVGTDDFMTERTRMEQLVFDDVIRVSIPDMYSFVAYKELATMKWMRKYLPSKKFYLKTEEHVVLNMKVLVERFLPEVEKIANERLIIGWFGSEHVVQRGTYQKFIDAVIPPQSNEIQYAMNLLYGVTSRAADLMLAALENVELIEYPGDPFVTGILRDVAQVKISNVGKSTLNLAYELSNGHCKDAFGKNKELLVCTTSLNIGSSQSMIEYFEAWNILIGQN